MSNALTFYIPHDTKIHHFRDILPSESFSKVLKKLNLTQQNQTYQKMKDATTQDKQWKLNAGLVVWYDEMELASQN